MGVCSRCGRRITAPGAIAVGLGRVCLKKVGNLNQTKLFGRTRNMATVITREELEDEGITEGPLLKPTTTIPKRIRDKVKIYDKVLTVLQDHPETRNSDDLLYWQVLFDLAFAVRKGDLFGNEYWLSKSEFMQAPRYESIRRSRQKAQQRFPELRETDPEVKKARDNKRKMGGNFIYGENARGRHV